MSAILITGATGTIGAPLVQKLSQHGVPARILVRNPEKAEPLKSATTEVAVGSFDDPESLASALAGVETLFLLTPPGPDQRIPQRAVLRLAHEAGISHVVKLSALGATVDGPVELGRQHAEIEHEIEASGVGYTFLKPHSFMQNLLGSIDSIKHQGAIYGATGEARYSLIDARDVADAAAAVLRDPSSHNGKTYHLTGPQALNQDEMAKLLGEAIGKEVSYVNLPPEAYEGALLEAGLPDWLALTLRQLAEFFATGNAAAVSPDVENLTGTGGRTFADFAAEHAPAFK